MARSKTGEAISARGRSPSGRKQLRRFIRAAEKAQDLADGAVVVPCSVHRGRRVADMAVELGVDRSSINRWLIWYEAKVSRAWSRAHRRDQRRGSRRPAYPSRGVGRARTGVCRVHQRRVDGANDRRPHRAAFRCAVPQPPHPPATPRPRLLRAAPRKRLARADAEKQAVWLRTTLPGIKKKPGLSRRRDVRR